MNNQLQTLIKILKKKKLTKIVLLMNPEKFHDSKGRNFVENCQPIKNLLGSLSHPFGGSLTHLFFYH